MNCTTGSDCIFLAAAIGLVAFVILLVAGLHVYDTWRERR